jgi:5-oxoprolinase (ATP-hydrolysing)
LYKRKDFAPGAEVIGPAMISEENSTTIVERGWRASFSTKGMLIERVEGGGGIGAGSLTTKRDPIYLEVFNNLFMRCDY